jgi:hypothetical protein
MNPINSRPFQGFQNLNESRSNDGISIKMISSSQKIESSIPSPMIPFDEISIDKITVAKLANPSSKPT